MSDDFSHRLLPLEMSLIEEEPDAETSGIRGVAILIDEKTRRIKRVLVNGNVLSRDDVWIVAAKTSETSNDMSEKSETLSEALGYTGNPDTLRAAMLEYRLRDANTALNNDARLAREVEMPSFHMAKRRKQTARGIGVATLPPRARGLLSTGKKSAGQQTRQVRTLDAAPTLLSCAFCGTAYDSPKDPVTGQDVLFKCSGGCAECYCNQLCQEEDLALNQHYLKCPGYLKH